MNNTALMHFKVALVLMPSLTIIACFHNFSSDIQSALIISSTERSVTKFAEMAELVKTLQGSYCQNLVKFANETVVFWYKILKEKFVT